MPNAQLHSQMTHPAQHSGFPITQNQYHMRPIQNVPPHIMNGGPQPGGPSSIPQQLQPTQDQQGHMSQYYSYAQMGMSYGMHGRLAPAYAWQMGMGRGVPGNGQHMAPNAVHTQKMLNVGKGVPGGMQGR